ncbi:hypothetical protein ACJIZ3_004717 [Penstemon smallii]|uniref:Uncharacterized protein n=1 Tax=Penstemon smallii TaxID=265156 RepID=A0ABD3S336_9LAMI
MGACATKFQVLKDGGDAPAPAPESVEISTKEVSVADISSKEVAPVEDLVAAAEDDEAKRQSLGNLFDKNEGAKGAPEEVKEAVVDVDAPVKAETEILPAKDGLKIETSEEKKTVEVKPAIKVAEAETSQTKIEEKVEDKQVVEPLKPEIPEAKKPETQEAKKPEAPEAKKPEIPEKKPETPESKKPETPEAKKPETPEAKKPETPESKKPETPEVKKPETPEKKPETPEEIKPEILEKKPEISKA